jgi:hypothetical protein
MNKLFTKTANLVRAGKLDLLKERVRIYLLHRSTYRPDFEALEFKRELPPGLLLLGREVTERSKEINEIKDDEFRMPPVLFHKVPKGHTVASVLVTIGDGMDERLLGIDDGFPELPLATNGSDYLFVTPEGSDIAKAIAALNEAETDSGWPASRSGAEIAANEVANFLAKLANESLKECAVDHLPPGRRWDLSLSFEVEKPALDPQRTQLLAWWYRHVHQGQPEPQPPVTVKGGYSVGVK